MLRPLLASSFLALVAVAPSLHSQRFEDVTLEPSVPQLGELFGHGVALDQDLAVAGSSWDGHLGTATGGLTIFRKDATTGLWAEDAHLHAPDPLPYAKFSMFVSVDASTRRVAAGSRGDQPNGPTSGSAYIFKEVGPGNWVLESKLVPPDSQADMHFGASIVLDGEWALVGAYKDDPNGFRSGSAYFYRFDSVTSTWLFHQKVFPANGNTEDRFGRYNHIRNGVASIGASKDDDFGTDCGSVYIYRYDSVTDLWVMEQQVFGNDANSSDRLGISSAVDGNVMVAGAFWDSDPGAVAMGSVYVYRRNSSTGLWKQKHKITPPVVQSYLYFGSYVMVENDIIVVGAYGDSEVALGAGAVFVYQFDPVRNKWGLVNKLMAAKGGSMDALGRFHCLSGDSIIIGNRFADSTGTDVGNIGIYKAIGFRLTATPSLAVPGSKVTMDVTGCDPNGFVGFALTGEAPFWGSHWSNTPGVTLDLANPYVLARWFPTDANGHFSIRVRVPPTAPSGASVAIQAFTYGKKSSVAVVTAL